MTTHLITGAIAAVLAYVSFTDILERRIPNKIMFPALGAALVLALIQPNRWLLLAGGLVAGAMLLLPVFIYGLERAGGGDVKLALFIGLVLGWPSVVVALTVAFVAAALIGAMGIIAKKLTRHSSLAFAPFLALGWLVAQVLASSGLASGLLSSGLLAGML